MLLQICAVIVTMALVAITVVTVRAMIRLEKAAADFSKTAEMVRDSIDQLQWITREARGIVATLGEIVPLVHGTVSRFEALGERAARLSSALLEEVETPLRTAAAAARGVRSGTARFFEQLRHRFKSRLSMSNGGFEHE